MNSVHFLFIWEAARSTFKERELPSAGLHPKCPQWQELDRDNTQEPGTQSRSSKWVVGAWLLQASPAPSQSLRWQEARIAGVRFRNPSYVFYCGMQAILSGGLNHRAKHPPLNSLWIPLQLWNYMTLFQMAMFSLYGIYKRIWSCERVWEDMSKRKMYCSPILALPFTTINLVTSRRDRIYRYSSYLMAILHLFYSITMMVKQIIWGYLIKFMENSY